MSYIDRNLLPGEQILFRTKKHFILFFWPAVMAVFAVIATNYMYHNDILHKLAPVPWLVTLGYWVGIGIEYLSSEYAVTNKRVMMREGFFRRHANEMRLSAISQVNVDQSLLGQLLNYGIVSINAFGAFDAYALIDRPMLFQRTVNQQLDTLTK